VSDVGYTTSRTLSKLERLLDNPLYLLERLNDSRAKVFLALREANQPIHISEVVKRTRLSRTQVYRATTFLNEVGLAAELHGYWYEKNPP
jgi:predicted transcriptional regulator